MTIEQFQEDNGKLNKVNEKLQNEYRIAMEAIGSLALDLEKLKKENARLRAIITDTATKRLNEIFEKYS